MYSRRARPTLRVIREDLASDWGSPYFRRALEESRVEALSPLSELPHPIIRKAADSFPDDPKSYNFVQPIVSSTQIRLLEIKNSQWRGEVWEDPETGVCWLLVAGLAKGEHQDSDDFYVQIKNQDKYGNPEHWLPTPEDLQILKRETAARLRTEWELGIQRQVLEGLRAVHLGGSYVFDVDHVLPEKGRIASVEVSVTQERLHNSGVDTDDISVDFVARSQYEGSNLLWALIQRVLISIEPPHQGWDRFANSFSNMGAPGAWTDSITDLAAAVEADELVPIELGKASHYAHTKHLAGNTIQGRGVRAMCGVYFVPAQDHQALPKCPTCSELYLSLPK